MILIALLAVPLALTSAEFCSAAPQPPATEPPEWHWRMVDGKKCYFRADKLLPREDLVWSYDAKKLDLDEGTTVRGQRHYAPQELKAIAIERQMRSPSLSKSKSETPVLEELRPTYPRQGVRRPRKARRRKKIGTSLRDRCI